MYIIFFWGGVGGGKAQVSYILILVKYVLFPSVESREKEKKISDQTFTEFEAGIFETV